MGSSKLCNSKKSKSEGNSIKKTRQTPNKKQKHLTGVEVDDEVIATSTEIISNSTEMAHFSLFVTNVDNVVLKPNQRLVTPHEEIVTSTEDPQNQPVDFPIKLRGKNSRKNRWMRWY